MGQKYDLYNKLWDLRQAIPPKSPFLEDCYGCTCAEFESVYGSTWRVSCDGCCLYDDDHVCESIHQRRAAIDPNVPDYGQKGVQGGVDPGFKAGNYQWCPL